MLAGNSFAAPLLQTKVCKVQSDVILLKIAGLQVTSRQPCWWSEQKHFSPLRTKIHFQVNSLRTKNGFRTTPRDKMPIVGGKILKLILLLLKKRGFAINLVRNLMYKIDLELSDGKRL